MKELIFGEGLMSPTLEGDKTFTVRRYRPEAHDFKEGEIVIGKFKDGLNILLRITRDTKTAQFQALLSPRVDQKEKGYYFTTRYFADLKVWYPDLKWDEVGAVVFTEVYKVDGVPVVALNEFSVAENPLEP